MTIVNVEQRLGWGVHDYTKDKALHEATKKHCMVKLGNYYTMWGPPVISWFISPSN